MTIVTSGAGPRAMGAEWGRWSLMIMSDTCATHRSRVPLSLLLLSFRSSSVGLETGEWHIKLIIKLHRPRSEPTALGPAPLVRYPHRPLQAGGTLDTALYPVRAAAAYLGVRTDEARENEMEGWGETGSREWREEKKKTNSRSVCRTHCRILSFFLFLSPLSRPCLSSSFHLLFSCLICRFSLAAAAALTG